MTGNHQIRIETPRLVLRAWRREDAPVMRQLWTERDPRVPPHRRIDADGHPSLAEIEEQILRPGQILGTLAAEDRVTGEVMGYAGLVDTKTGGPGEPEIAFEFLRSRWGQGLATEAGDAVIGWARGQGIRRLWATVWDWNVASRRVLGKLNFVETGMTSGTSEHGTSLVVTRSLETI